VTDSKSKLRSSASPLKGGRNGWSSVRTSVSNAERLHRAVMDSISEKGRMSTSATDFINLDAFTKVLAEQLRESLPYEVIPKRVFNLDEAAEYCGLTRDSFKKKGVRDRLRKISLDNAGGSIRPTWTSGLRAIKGKSLSKRRHESKPNCVWLFSQNGRPIKDFNATWGRACQKAAIPGLLFNDLRRTAVRNMMRAGVPERPPCRLPVTRPQACCGATASGGT
jgi:hypothetical protein